MGGTAVAQAQCSGEHVVNNSPPLQRALYDFYQHQQQRQNFSGISLQVSQSSNVPTLDAAMGATAFWHGRDLCSDTLFGIGSITKSFTSVLILKLEAEGKLSIHDRLGKWLPEYPRWSSITIEQLLNMTAPTYDYLSTAAFQRDLVANPSRTFQPRELIAYVYPGPSGTQAPWHYSNTNYILAGIIISKITGLSYADALWTKLFKPLALTTAYYEPRVPPPAVLAAMPDSYDDDSQCEDNANVAPPCEQQPLDMLLGQDVRPLTLSVYGSAGGIIASLPDVNRWVRALFSDTLLPARQKAELFALVSETTGLPIAATSAKDPLGYSLGIGQALLPFLKAGVWYYEGEPFGDRVAWLRLPADKLVVVMGLNSSATTPKDLIAPLYESVLKIFEPSNVTTPVGSPNPPTGN
jgi:D-alanyl-D-alanine carboxypeptidase